MFFFLSSCVNSKQEHAWKWQPRAAKYRRQKTPPDGNIALLTGI
jgi:hypothetical protein